MILAITADLRRPVPAPQTVQGSLAITQQRKTSPTTLIGVNDSRRVFPEKPRVTQKQESKFKTIARGGGGGGCFQLNYSRRPLTSDQQQVEVVSKATKKVTETCATYLFLTRNKNPMANSRAEKRPLLAETTEKNGWVFDVTLLKVLRRRVKKTQTPFVQYWDFLLLCFRKEAPVGCFGDMHGGTP